MRCSTRSASASTVATPAYPRNGRTVFKGNLFVGDAPRRIGDEDHPLTPMRDSNLVRVLAAQTPHEVGLVPSGHGRRAARYLKRFEELRKSARYAVLDAVRDEHLVAAGEACRDMTLTTGGAGLAMGIARALGKRGPAAQALPRLGGPAVVLAGSCSQATLGQIAAWTAPALKLDPHKLDAAAAVDWAARNLESTPLIYASAPGRSRRGAAKPSSRRFATWRARARRKACASSWSRAARPPAPWSRRLGCERLPLARRSTRACPGPPRSAASHLLALKSGNFGSRDFFRKALEMVA